jgi:hypothetical protein
MVLVIKTRDVIVSLFNFSAVQGGTLVFLIRKTYLISLCLVCNREIWINRCAVESCGCLQAIFSGNEGDVPFMGAGEVIWCCPFYKRG